MIIRKITTGFVVQTFDTEKNKWTDQEFIAGDECVYEDELGVPIDAPENMPYLRLRMEQP
jgi:hypothetical protein